VTTVKQRRHRLWALISVVLVLALAAGTLLPASQQASKTAHLWGGVLGAALFAFAIALGLRKRYLRLPLGSMSAWTTAHLWLGGAAFAVGLWHARFRPGSALGASLLVALLLVVVSGVVGVVMQSIVPRLMTSRLPDESPADDLGPVFAEHARSVDALIERTACEGAVSDEALAALRSFHDTTVVPFFRTPLSQHTLLAHEAEATLAFDALRAGVDTPLHPVIEQLRAICDEARLRAEEGRLRRSLQGWLWIHIPASVFALVLLIAHALSALYY
jgi:hypothetical protein